jgi:2-(1,2-epoxy-1,2-dihydrophenyl)acetyl-CoA isomerase
MSNAFTTIRLDIREGVAHFTLTRADAANTMNLAFGREFLAAAAAVRKDPAVRAVLLRGEGRNFCFGGDLRAMVAAGADINAYLTQLTTDVHAGMIHLARTDAPVVVAVQGTAAGAGLGLVLAADLAIAGKSAKFAASYTAVGLTPDAGTTFSLPRAVGYKRAMELFLTNRVLDAERALDWGLVNQVVEDDKLAETAAALAARLAAGPTGAFGGVKRLLAEAEPGCEAQLARESRAIAAGGETPEGREGIAAFLEKRTPKFS